MQTPVKKIMGKLAISEMVLFDKLSNKQRAAGRVVDIFRWWVSTNLEPTKQWVDPELMRAWNGILLRWSWPRIKGEVRETKSECIESNWTCCCIGKFNTALSLCRVLRVTFYFSKGSSEAAARILAVAEAPQSLGETIACFLGQKSSLWSSVLQ